MNHLEFYLPLDIFLELHQNFINYQLTHRPCPEKNKQTNQTVKISLLNWLNWIDFFIRIFIYCLLIEILFNCLWIAWTLTFVYLILSIITLILNCYVFKLKFSRQSNWLVFIYWKVLLNSVIDIFKIESIEFAVFEYFSPFK